MERYWVKKIKQSLEKKSSLVVQKGVTSATPKFLISLSPLGKSFPGTRFRIWNDIGNISSRYQTLFRA